MQLNRSMLNISRKIVHRGVKRSCLVKLFQKAGAAWTKNLFVILRREGLWGRDRWMAEGLSKMRRLRSYAGLLDWRHLEGREMILCCIRWRILGQWRDLKTGVTWLNLEFLESAPAGELTTTWKKIKLICQKVDKQLQSYRNQADSH